jgi:hypothetical protein
MASQAISTTDVQKAAQELAKMRRSLAAWLKYRTINDSVLAGTITKIRKPLPYAQRVIASSRSMANEQDLADKLSTLLTQLMPGQTLPNANLATNPDGAVQLAQLALQGAQGQVMQSAAATGNILATPQHPWLWPVLIVGGLLLVVTTAIKSSADVAKDQEEKACIEAGACTDYGFWLKAGGIIALTWFAWTQLGVGDVVRNTIKKKGGAR